MSKIQKCLFGLASFLCLLSTASYGQEIDSALIEGEQFYIYPFRVDVLSETEYFLAMSISRRGGIGSPSFKDFKKYSEDELGEYATRSDYREFKHLVRSFSRNKQYEDDQKHLNKKFIKAVRANPYPLLQQRFSANQDLTPILDPIPDGKYIQYYSDFCLVDEKGDCMSSDSFVAGYFTFKNNVLHGEAVWIDLAGDTLKNGYFVDGLKEGEWKYETRRAPYSINKKHAEQYIEQGTIDLDTTVEYITYADGVRNGSYKKFESSDFPIETGYYTNGIWSGEWVFRDICFKMVKFRRVRIRHNKFITRRLTYASDKDLVVNQKWLRSRLIETYSANLEQFDFFSEYEILPPKFDLYSIDFETEPQVELEEEIDYEIYDEYIDEYAYYDEEFDYEASSYQAREYDSRLEQYKNRGVLMDSLGGIPNYSGVLESFYPNGQLAYRYEFVDGLLLKEDTIFWDNGTAHDVITELPDSNQYLRSVYDYEGKLFMELFYDSLMDFVRVKRHEVEVFTILDGLKADRAGYGDYFYYSVFDTLGNELNEPLLLYRSWFTGDSTMMYSTNYDPESRVLSYVAISALGNTVYKDDRTFADDFESWTGKKTTVLGDIELVQTSSGSLYDWLTADSIPQRYVSSSYEMFDVARDYKFKKASELYTGAAVLNFNKRKLSISKKGLTINLPRSKSLEKKLLKDLARYREKGKTKFPLIMSLIDASDTEINVALYFTSTFFNASLGNHFSSYSPEYLDYGEGSEIEFAATDKIVGYMKDGKPQGLWVSYDQFGNKILEMSFDHGEADGEMISYSYEYPKQSGENMYEFGYTPESFLQDSLPKKKTHYVAKSANYSKGLLHGSEIIYNWCGEETARTNYLDGYLEGKSIQRNKLAHSEMSYSDGQLDGYYQTYLTIPNRDSVLLFDLNFQDGLLQGESKSYHMNGQLAKRGFFLDGAPIEDYEAYDTLGFRYHYVKFKYSFPVEEKIWEENELSVRYQFSWQDSIAFQPSDITTSQSLERTLYELGLGGNYLSQPYYGRPSLVNKSGVSYRLTKYFPNDTISRDGEMSEGKKSGCWKYYSYDGEHLYEVDYFDSIIELNDSIKFKSKGVLSDFDSKGNLLHESYLIEKFSKYDCAHSDHYEVRQFCTFWEANDSTHRMNGFTRNFYDNGTLQSEGNMKNGLPDGIWKLYDPFGRLNHYGLYVQGKRDGRWLSGDLSKTKYLGDICLNPNLPDLAEEIKYRENLLDVTITNYKLGKSLNKQYYDINMNRFYEEDETAESEIQNESIEE